MRSSAACRETVLALAAEPLPPLPHRRSDTLFPPPSSAQPDAVAARALFAGVGGSTARGASGARGDCAG
eukprot:1161397-Rhodomonas_salina.1